MTPQLNAGAPHEDTGPALSDIGITFMLMMIGFPLLGFGAISLQKAQENRMEISAQSYQALASMAGKSCAGRVLLKQAASKGPILGADYSRLMQSLQEKAAAQSSANARALVINLPNACV